MDNDLFEVCGHLSDSDILASVTTVTSTQTSDEEQEQGQELTETLHPLNRTIKYS